MSFLNEFYKNGKSSRRMVFFILQNIKGGHMNEKTILCGFNINACNQFKRM